MSRSFLKSEEKKEFILHQIESFYILAQKCATLYFSTVRNFWCIFANPLPILASKYRSTVQHEDRLELQILKTIMNFKKVHLIRRIVTRTRVGGIVPCWLRINWSWSTDNWQPRVEKQLLKGKMKFRTFWKRGILIVLLNQLTWNFTWATA